jgi:hypothetical protein
MSITSKPVSPTARAEAINIGRAASYPFEDPQWPVKLIVFLIVGFIPGLNLILWSGYAITVARNIIHGHQYPLPTWAAWTDIAVRGFLAIVATALYFLPVLLIAGCVTLTSLVLAVRGSPQNLESTLLALRCVAFILALLYTANISTLLWSGHLRFAQTDQFYHYLAVGQRFRDITGVARLVIALFGYQSLLAFLLLLLSAISAMLFIIALTVAATAGVFFGLVALLGLALALLGYVALVTLAFLANAYFLGNFGRMVAIPVRGSYE